MPLPAGARLGTHEIVSLLGAGGMGEVYRARDTRLGRDVAVKVVIAAFAADGDRVARFQREAKVLASLNHPHIAALYGLEEDDGRHFLVMELVEGQTLADRLTRGPLPPDEAIAIAIQIADGLEAAHEKGVVHRDLKPANVKVTPDDRVKVLDFGLAKAVETETASSSAANSPTLSMMASQAGIILGTAAYMSPEQAKGSPADHRSDIFSFGALLFEMLSGRQPFQGDTVPDVMASVLVREPDLSRLPADLNPRLVDLVRRCLEKQPKRRWQAIGDVRAELEAIAVAPRSGPIVTAPPVPGYSSGRLALSAALWTMLGVALASAVWLSRPAPVQVPVRFTVRLPEGFNFAETGRYLLAISPDGRSIAYGAQSGGTSRLYVRELADLDARAVAGTDTTAGLSSPAFSPDGRSIAYYSVAEHALKRVSVSGGTPITLCDASQPTGVSWNHGYVYLGQADRTDTQQRGVLRVPEAGGRPEVVIKVDGTEIADGPQVLPDGDTVMFALGKVRANLPSARWDEAQIVGQSLRSGARTVFVTGGSSATYVSSGQLLYATSGTLFAVPFNLRTLKAEGTPVTVLEGVRRSTGSLTGSADFVLSSSGTAAYVPGPRVASMQRVDLGFADLAGKITPLNLPLGPYRTPRVSPDGTRVAFASDDNNEAFILIYALSGGSAMRRLTRGGKERLPVWCGDKHVVFQADAGDVAIYRQAADGSGAAERLTTPGTGESDAPRSCSPDGATLLFDRVRGPEVSLQVLTVKDRRVAPFGSVRSPTGTNATFSRDGKWVVYTLAPPARTFVQPFPATGDSYQVPSTASAHAPAWSPDGKTLYFIPGPGGFEGVAVTSGPPIVFGNPFRVQRTFGGSEPTGPRLYDLTPDGRFLGIIRPGQPDGSGGMVAPPLINVVLHWLDELKARSTKRGE